MLEFIRDQLGLDDIPNQETLEALAELKYMEAHPEEYKSYISVDEMFDEILGEGEYNNIMKAVRNAEYLAEIDRAATQFEAGKDQIHDLIEVEDDECGLV